jgi:hypothetical protein
MKQGQSKSFMLELEKIEAFSLGGQDEINQRRRRSRAFYIKKFGEDGEEIHRSYLLGYENSREFRKKKDKPK